MKCSRRQVHCLQGELVEVADDYRDGLAQIGVGPGLNWTHAGGDELVSKSLASRCYRTRLADGRVVYFKRYVYPKKFWLEFWLRPGKAAVEFWAYQRLKQLGIPTLNVVAFGERRFLGMLLATFIVTEEVPETVELEKFTLNTWCRLPRLQRQQIFREVSAQLLEQLRVAHQGQFFHHDLKWRNILLQLNQGQYSPLWIDAPRASRMRFRRRRGIVTDLSGLARIAVSLFSRYELMRFLCRYLGPGRRPGEAKQLFREVAAHLGRRRPPPLELNFPD